jgi:hypothetical protein
MNEADPKEAVKKHGWSAMRKAQVVGAIIGAALTVAYVVYDRSSAPHDPVDLSTILGVFVVGPTALIWHLLGLNLHLYTDSYSAGNGPVPITQVVVPVLCLIVIVNSLICLLLGTLFGWILQSFRERREFYK